MLRQSVALVLAGMLLVPAAPAAELPVKKVVLYKHGIGYFERSGRVAASEAARLDFKAVEMNDVLKSLTIEERGGGKVSGVRYDSSEPVEHKLKEFPFSIGPAQPLAAILDQLKGSRVELRFGADRVEGVLVGARVAPASERQPEKQEAVVMLPSGELRSVDLMAAWKSSYRLVLDAGPEPLLEGWAIVDNTTGDDWSNISLALVSGLPVSFITQLYEPRYVARPEAELPQDRAQRPILHAGAI